MILRGDDVGAARDQVGREVVWQAHFVAGAQRGARDGQPAVRAAAEQGAQLVASVEDGAVKRRDRRVAGVEVGVGGALFHFGVQAGGGAGVGDTGQRGALPDFVLGDVEQGVQAGQFVVGAGHGRADGQADLFRFRLGGTACRNRGGQGFAVLAPQVEFIAGADHATVFGLPGAGDGRGREGGARVLLAGQRVTGVHARQGVGIGAFAVGRGGGQACLGHVDRRTAFERFCNQRTQLRVAELGGPVCRGPVALLGGQAGGGFQRGGCGDVLVAGDARVVGATGQPGAEQQGQDLGGAQGAAGHSRSLRFHFLICQING